MNASDAFLVLMAATQRDDRLSAWFGRAHDRVQRIVERVYAPGPTGDTWQDHDHGRTFTMRVEESAGPGKWYVSGRSLGRSRDIMSAADIDFEKRAAAQRVRSVEAGRLEREAEAAKEAAKLAKKRDLRGFTDGMPAIQARRVEEVLDKVVRTVDGPATRRDIVERMVDSGARVLTLYGARHLRSVGGQEDYDETDIAKTGMDYAAFLTGAQVDAPGKLRSEDVRAQIDSIDRQAMQGPGFTKHAERRKAALMAELATALARERKAARVPASMRGQASPDAARSDAQLHADAEAGAALVAAAADRVRAMTEERIRQWAGSSAGYATSPRATYIVGDLLSGDAEKLVNDIKHGRQSALDVTRVVDDVEKLYGPARFGQRIRDAVARLPVPVTEPAAERPDGFVSEYTRPLAEVILSMATPDRDNDAAPSFSQTQWDAIRAKARFDASSLGALIQRADREATFGLHRVAIFGEAWQRIVAQARGALLPDEPVEQKRDRLAAERQAARTAGYRGDIPWSVAQAAHAGTSHVPDQRGQQELDDYQRWLEHALATLEQHATSPAARAQVPALFEEYRRGYRTHFLAMLGAKGRTISSMITGPSKFPTSRAGKASDAADKRVQELIDWRTKALNSAVKQISATTITAGGGPLADLERRIEERKAEQERWKAINKIVRGKGTDAEKGAAMQALGVLAHEARAYLTPDFAGRLGVPSFKLTNNLAEIKRLEERLAVEQGKEAMAAASADGEDRTFDVPASAEHPSATVTYNLGEDRLQVQFAERTSRPFFEKMRGAGFVVTREGVFQRKLNDNAVASLNYTLKLDLPNVSGG